MTEKLFSDEVIELGTWHRIGDGAQAILEKERKQSTQFPELLINCRE